MRDPGLTMFRRFFRFRFAMTDYVPLGRWTRTERAANAIKVDLANTDHCGTCPLPLSKKTGKISPVNLNKSHVKTKE